VGKKENERSKNDEVCTPAEVFQPVLDALGWDQFDLDPCSHPRSIIPSADRIMLPQYRGVPCALNSPTVYNDGLKITWRKQRVWKNPPYSQLQYTKKYPWLEKAANEAKRCVGWLPTRTSSQWWHEYVRQAAAVCLWKGRVQHVGEEWGSPFHQALVFWGFTIRELNKLERALDVRHGGRHWFLRVT
jgi:hypothetical protein